MDYIGSEEDTCLQLKFETEFNSAYIQHWVEGLQRLLTVLDSDEDTEETEEEQNH